MLDGGRLARRSAASVSCRIGFGLKPRGRMGLEVRPEEHEGGAQPADSDPYLVHALRAAGGCGGLRA
jgi:hypothetical protein